MANTGRLCGFPAKLQSVTTRAMKIVFGGQIPWKSRMLKKGVSSGTTCKKSNEIEA
jgi:hypothetical protein